MTSAPAAAERSSPRPLAVGSAMLVDDSSADRRSITRMLNANGIGSVLEADSAFEAYSILKSSRVDLILIDVIMPSIGGIKLLRAVRQTAATSRVPIIMITASRDASHVQDARAAWADGYLLKPFTPDTLRAMISAALRGKGFAGPDPDESGTTQQVRTSSKVRVGRFFGRH